MRFLFVAAILSLLASGCPARMAMPKQSQPPIAPASDASAAPDSAKAAEPAPADNAAADNAVTVQQLDFAGIEKLVASHQGRVVVMDAWSLSCPPASASFRSSSICKSRYPPQQLACISLSFDYDGIGQPADKLPRVETFCGNNRPRSTMFWPPTNRTSSIASFTCYRCQRFSSMTRAASCGTASITSRQIAKPTRSPTRMSSGWSSSCWPKPPPIRPDAATGRRRKDRRAGRLISNCGRAAPGRRCQASPDHHSGPDGRCENAPRTKNIMTANSAVPKTIAAASITPK